MDKPELKISVFSDYICPFCYVANKRLNILHKQYDLKINWCFIEIHPETPIDGGNFKDLPYSDSEFKALIENLETMASQEDLNLLKQSVTANSHNAILFSEFCKAFGKDIFYKVHNRLYEAFFEEGINIGNPDELFKIADHFDIKKHHVENALSSEEMERHLPIFLKWAAKLEITSVPAFVFGDKVLKGVLKEQELINEAETLLEKSGHIH